MVCGPWLSHLGILKGNPKSSIHHKVHPRKLAWTPKNPYLNWKSSSKTLNYHVSFRGVKFVTIARKMKEGYFCSIVFLLLNPTLNLKPNSPALAAAFRWPELKYWICWGYLPLMGQTFIPNTNCLKANGFLFQWIGSVKGGNASLNFDWMNAN